MSSARPSVLGFVAPALDGPPTGGTLYDAGLIAALRRAGVSCELWEPSSLPSASGGRSPVILVDSLYLDAMPALRARARHACLGLLLHWLPSLVREGTELTWRGLSAVERSALELADAVMVTSPFMARIVEGLRGRLRPLFCVEPGVELPARQLDPAARPADEDVARAVMLSNVIDGKGVIQLLHALSAFTRADDRFTLDVIGSLDAEPEYAAACLRMVQSSDVLSPRVRLRGALPHALALEILRRSDVLLSASRMESYGMALAEARALSVPIVARAGGHAGEHVDAGAGGELVADEAQVAERFLSLVRTPLELRARKQAAAVHARARSWDMAAAELLAHLPALGL